METMSYLNLNTPNTEFVKVFLCPKSLLKYSVIDINKPKTIIEYLKKDTIESGSEINHLKRKRLYEDAFPFKMQKI
jgi:hypothetical protein